MKNNLYKGGGPGGGIVPGAGGPEGRWISQVGSCGQFFRFFFRFFFEHGFGKDFSWILEPKIGAKTSFWRVFCDAFLEGILESIFRLFF